MYQPPMPPPPHMPMPQRSPFTYKRTWAAIVGTLLFASSCGAAVGAAGEDDTRAAEAGKARPTVTTTATTTARATVTASPKARPTVTKTKKVEVKVTVTKTKTQQAAADDGSSSGGGGGESSAYYANCSEARAAGAAPVYAGEPGYGRHLDRDGDGVGCDS